MRASLLIPSLLAIVPLQLAAPLRAQDQKVPEGWVIRADGGHAMVGAGHREAGDAASHEIRLADMPPGWHVTTGPAAILYDSERTASGAYRVVADLVLFPPGEVSDGYGVFVGGRALDGNAQSYLFFQVRRDGAFRIARRDGERVRILRDWSRHESVKPWTTGTVTNALAVHAGTGNVAFLVNGTAVAELPRADLELDGVFGLRIEAGMNLHVTRLEKAPAGAGPP
jgi:hypothetical protein